MEALLRGMRQAGGDDEDDEDDEDGDGDGYGSGEMDEYDYEAMMRRLYGEEDEDEAQEARGRVEDRAHEEEEEEKEEEEEQEEAAPTPAPASTPPPAAPQQQVRCWACVVVRGWVGARVMPGKKRAGAFACCAVGLHANASEAHGVAPHEGCSGHPPRRAPMPHPCRAHAAPVPRVQAGDGAHGPLLGGPVINVFTVASGHMYERLQKIMVLSVLRHTASRVKFWFIKNYMSPQHKQVRLGRLGGRGRSSGARAWAGEVGGLALPASVHLACATRSLL